MKEIRTVVTEKKVEFQGKSISMAPLGKLWTITILNQGSEDMISQWNLSLNTVKGSIETLMEEIKAVVTEKHDFEYRDESIVKSTFWELRAISSLIQGSKQ